MEQAVDRGLEVVETGEVELLKIPIPGIPLVAEGEKLVWLEQKGRQELIRVGGEAIQMSERRWGSEGVTGCKVRNLVFEAGRNKSWICDVEGFDKEMLIYLSQPGAMTARMLNLTDELVELSGCGYMLEVGFNVGREEVVFKRMLLPPTFSEEVMPGKVGEVWQGAGEKMPDVFLKAWEMLEVGRYDQEWDQAVRDYLLGNVRDLEKEIRYRMMDGRKLVWWQGQWLWAGLLSDVSDIGRFLAEEAVLAGLRPGEALVTYYGHGGGAISAATKGETPEQPVADVQIMGEDGEIYQQAVEAPEGEIEALAGQLVNEMRSKYGLAEPGLVKTVGIDRGWFRENGVLLGGSLSLTEEVVRVREAKTNSETGEKGVVTRTIMIDLGSKPAINLSGLVDEGVEAGPVEMIGGMMEAEVVEFGEVYSGEPEWWEGGVEDEGVDWSDEGGDGDGSGLPETPGPSGGLVFKPEEVPKPAIRVDMVEKKEEVVAIMEREEGGETKEMMVVDEREVKEKQQVSELEVEVVKARVSEEEVVYQVEIKEQRVKEEGNKEGGGMEIPVWEGFNLQAMEEVDVPVWQGMELSVPVNGGLEVIKNGVEAGEMFFEGQNWSIFEYCCDFSCVAVALLYAMLGNKLVRLQVPIELVGGVVKQQMVI
jgi:hypothetical protein